MSTNIRSASRNSEMEMNRTASRGAGDTSAKRKLSARGESSKSQGLSSTKCAARASHSAADLEVSDAEASGSAASRSSSRISLGSRSRSNMSQASIRSGMMTPTKHVSLTAVQRKQERDDLPFEPELDWREFTRTNSSLRFDGLPRTNSFQLSQAKGDTNSNNLEDAADSYSKDESQTTDDRERSTGEIAEVTAKMEAAAITEGDNPQGAEAKEESSSDEEDSDEEPRKAPNELLMEFLDCIMKKEFETAEKLCRMILIYEPDNKEALTFHPIIMEKLQLDQEAAEAEKEGNADDAEDDDSDDEEDDDDDDDDDEDSDEDSSSETDSSNDEDDNENNFDEPNREGAIPPRPDSGIGL